MAQTFLVPKPPLRQDQQAGNGFAERGGADEAAESLLDCHALSGPREFLQTNFTAGRWGQSHVC